MVLFPISIFCGSLKMPLVCSFVGLALSVAALALVVTGWLSALSKADDWALPPGGNPAVPPQYDPGLWKLVRNRQYGIGIIVGSVLDL